MGLTFEHPPCALPRALRADESDSFIAAFRLLKQQIDDEASRLSALAWEMERDLHRLRIARVGASGIQHRAIEAEEAVREDMKVTFVSVAARRRATEFYSK